MPGWRRGRWHRGRSISKFSFGFGAAPYLKYSLIHVEYGIRITLWVHEQRFSQLIRCQLDPKQGSSIKHSRTEAKKRCSIDFLKVPGHSVGVMTIRIGSFADGVGLSESSDLVNAKLVKRN